MTTLKKIILLVSEVASLIPANEVQHSFELEDKIINNLNEIKSLIQLIPVEGDGMRAYSRKKDIKKASAKEVWIPFSYFFGRNIPSYIVKKDFNMPNNFSPFRLQMEALDMTNDYIWCKKNHYLSKDLHKKPKYWAYTSDNEIVYRIDITK